MFAGRYDEATSWAEKGLSQQPNSGGAARVAAASNALAGRLDQAHKATARLREIDAYVSGFRSQADACVRQPENIERFEEGLRKTGLPD
jgi:hypothetical protein